MKKGILYFLKFVNHFTNSSLAPKKEAESIVNYIFYKTDILHAIAVKEEIDKQMKERLLYVREKYSEVIVKIDETYSPEPEKIIHHLNN